MSLSDDIAADLPAPRDDEPESLRQDIVDELSDHLHCSLHRELLASGHSSPDQQASPGRQSGDSDIEQSARQHVLNRFGPPAQIARQLWWDAMKERIMAQKITATMATLAAAACIVMAVLVWQSTLRDSSAAQQLLQAQQELNQTLLAELKSMRETSSAAATNAGWAPVSVELRSEAGKPADGRVRIHGTAINAGNDNEIDTSRTTDETGEAGVADFGLLPFGNYELSVVTTALGEEHKQKFMLSPNTPPELTIVCPTEPPPAVEVSFGIDVPPPLHADRLVFFAAFERPPRKTSSGTWLLEEKSQQRLQILFDAEGTILGDVSNMRVIDEGRTFPGSISPSADGFFRPPTGRRTSEVTRLYEGRLVSAPTVRVTDRCTGLGIAALPADHLDDGTVFRYVLATWPFTAEDAKVTFFPDQDPDEESMRITFDPPASFWEMVIAGFRRSADVADATIPEGWTIVQLPTDIRNFAFARGGGSRSRSQRGGRPAQDSSKPRHLQVWVTLPDQSMLPVGTGDALSGISRSRLNSSEEMREAMQGNRKLDVNLLVPPELAEAIELARTLGELEAIRIPEDEVDEVEPGVNQETLETMQQLAAAREAEDADAKNE